MMFTSNVILAVSVVSVLSEDIPPSQAVVIEVVDGAPSVSPSAPAIAPIPEASSPRRALRSSQKTSSYGSGGYGYEYTNYPEYGYPHWGDHMCRYEKDHYGKWSCTISYKADCEWLMKGVNGMDPKAAEYYYNLCQCAVADTKYQCHEEYLKKNHYCQWLEGDYVYGKGHGLCVTSQYKPYEKIEIKDYKRVSSDFKKVQQWRNERKYYCESLEYSDECLCPSLTNSGAGWNNRCYPYEPRSYEKSYSSGGYSGSSTGYGY